MASPLSHQRHRPDAAALYWCRAIGRLAVHTDAGDPRPLMGSGKPVAILVYLALAGGRASRDHIAELFWPGASLSEARHDLRQILYRLRQFAGGAELVHTEGTDLQLSPTVTFDFLEGEQAVAEGDLARVCELFRGNFLEGFTVEGSKEFERWLEAQRSRFRGAWTLAARALAEQHLTSGDVERALALAEELAAVNPFDERAIRLVMSALVQSGRHATALARFQAYRELLGSEVEDVPGGQLLEYVHDIQRYLESRPSPSEAVLPFVGREEQWPVLEAAWTAAREGGGGAVLVEGASGLGKSRILAELGHRVVAAGGTRLTAKCYEIEQSVPYGAVAEALRGAVERPELSTLAGSWLAEVARILPELRERLPGIPPADRDGGSPASKRRLHEAIARCLEAVAEEGPVLLAVDDVHWADVSSLEVLHFLAHRLREAPVLLVATYRPAELSPEARRFARSLMADRLAGLAVLVPLGEDDVRELLRGLAAFEEDHVAAGVTAHLHRACAGNPLFLSELLQALARDGTLAARGGRWHLAGGMRSEDLPRTLVKLMSDRLDRLAPWMRACVETLAVVGDMVTVDQLAESLHISEPRAELAMSVLEEERLVRRAGAGAWELVHDELRRLVYQGIPDDRRRLLHAAVGAALEARGEARRPGGAARLAHHFDQAGDLERAHRYALRAASEAGALAAPEAARVHEEMAAAHSARALPPGAGERGFTTTLGRLRGRIPGVAAAGVVVTIGLGALLLGSERGAGAGDGGEVSDYRQGTLYLGAGWNAESSFVLRWPRQAGEPGRIEAIGRPLRDGPTQLVGRWVPVGNATHQKLFRISGSDTVQVTFGASDDVIEDWSPDGRFALMQRGWKASASHFQTNIFVVDDGGRVVRRITTTRHQDQSAMWSPTGARIVFLRDSLGIWSLWLADVDGANAENLTGRFGLPTTLSHAAFAANGVHLAVVYPSAGGGSGALYVVDLGEGTARAVQIPYRRLAGVFPAWSPDGQWVAIGAELQNDPALWAVPVAGGAAPLRIAALPKGMNVLRWTGGEPRYVETVSITPRVVSLRTGFGSRVVAGASTRDGEPTEIALRWSTVDTTIARVDEVGFVVGRSPGTTRLIASAGGFRADTVEVSVEFAAVDTLFVETWERGLDTAVWESFGQPRPRVGVHSDGVPGFLNGGDYNHLSGAVSRQAFAIEPGGITIEVPGWVRLTGSHWQDWHVSVFADRPDATPAEGPQGGPVQLAFGGHSPTAQRPAWSACGSTGQWDLSELSWLNNRWHDYAIQVRLDGVSECFMDGRLLGRQEVPESIRGRPVSVVIAGRMEGTEIYHGRVVVTRGLRY